MSAGLSLLLAIVVSLGLSAILVYVLSVPLHRVLNALCTTGEATQFWVSFTSVMLFIAPLLFAVYAVSPEAGLGAAQVVRRTLQATLLGSSVALTAVGLKLTGATPPPRATASR